MLTLESEPFSQHGCGRRGQALHEVEEIFNQLGEDIGEHLQNNAFHPMASKYASLWWIVFQSKALSKFSINLEMPFVLQLTQLGRHLQTSYCISPKPQRSLNEPAVRLQCGGCECSSVAVVKFQCSRSEHSSVAVVNVPALQ